MVTRYKKQANDFNALEYKIFQQTETPVLSESYLDGRWDGGLGNDPSFEQWSTPEFRRGYLEGIANRLDEKYGLV